MRSLRNWLDRRKKLFGKGGRLESFHPLFDTVDTFLYSPGDVTGTAPHVRDAMDLKRLMMVVLLALMPCVFVAIYNTGLQANLAMARMGAEAAGGWRGSLLTSLGIAPEPGSLLSNLALGTLYFFPVYMVCGFVACFWEALFAVFRKREMNEMSIVTTLLFALLLPPTIPLWQAALGISFGVVIGKEVFGGVGMNVLNPSLVGYAFLFFAYPAQISGERVWVAVDGVSQATPLAEFADPALSVSATWTEAFLGFVPGAMGETSTLACLVGAAILILTGVGSWRIMAAMLAGTAAFSSMFNLIGSPGNPMFQVTPLWHFVLGGFALGTVFMATDPVTAAATAGGQYIYGLLIGGLVVIIRVINPAFTEGVMLAILFGNVFAPVIDKAVVWRNIKRRLAKSAE